MKNILVPLDLKHGTEKVLSMATEIALATGSKLWLLHVAAPEPDFVGYEAGPQYIRDEQALELREDRSTIQNHAKTLQAKGLSVQPVMVAGPTLEVILQEANRVKADLIIVGSQGRHGLAKAFMGSVSDEVVHEYTFPVLVVPTQAAR